MGNVKNRIKNVEKAISSEQVKEMYTFHQTPTGKIVKPFTSEEIDPKLIMELKKKNPESYVITQPASILFKKQNNE